MMRSLSNPMMTIQSLLECTLLMCPTLVSENCSADQMGNAYIVSVKSNMALDREARKRATSVYLVQRAVPMLPPQLSEELCSLQPGVERLAFSASFTLDKDANVVSRNFSKTIIK